MKARRFDVLAYQVAKVCGFHQLPAPRFPSTLMIEPVNLCNLGCPTCPTGRKKLNRPGRLMTFDEFKKIIDEARGRIGELYLWNYGEPFLNKDLNRMTRYATDAGMAVTISTNAQFLETDDACREVIESGLRTMIVCLDGIDQGTVEKFRRGTDYAKTLSGVERFVKVRTAMGSPWPEVMAQMLDMKQNQGQHEDVRQLAAKIGIDFFLEKTLWIDFNDPDFQKLAQEFLPDNRDECRYFLRDGKWEQKGHPVNYCSLADTSAVINSDGTVVSCCYDIYSQHPMGNVFEQSLESIWNGEKFRAFRKAIHANRKAIPICQGCPEGRLTISHRRYLWLARLFGMKLLMADLITPAMDILGK